MKGIKMLGVAIVATMAMMAFAGAGTASAAETAFCKNSPCQSSWPAGTEFTAKSPLVKLITEEKSKVWMTMTCESAITFKAAKSSGEPLGWSATALTWSNCKGCKAVTTTAQPAGTATATGGGNGTLKASGEAELSSCPLGITCKVKATNGGLTLAGGASGAAKLNAVNVPLAVSGSSLCGTSGTLNAGGEETQPYTVVTAKESGKEPISNPSLFAGWVGGGSSTILCKVKESPCAAANQYPLPWGWEIKAESPAITFSGGGVVPQACEPSAITFRFNEEPGKISEPLNGKVTGMTWQGCHACPDVTMKTLPSFSLSGTGSGNGAFSTTSETEVERENCGFSGKHCPMTIGAGTSLGFLGGTIGGTAKVSFAVPVSVSGESTCIKFNSWNANGTLESQPYVIKSVNGITTGSIFVA
jgi:hypothetical protein